MYRLQKFSEISKKRKILSVICAVIFIFSAANLFLILSKTEEPKSEEEIITEELPEASVEGTFVDCISLLEEINTYREDAGAGAVEWDTSMQNGAEIRAIEVCDLVSHDRPDGTSFSTVPGNAIAENLARGSYTFDNIIDAFAGSEEHYATMINDKYTYVYMSCYETELGSSYIMHFR